MCLTFSTYLDKCLRSTVFNVKYIILSGVTPYTVAGIQKVSHNCSMSLTVRNSKNYPTDLLLIYCFKLNRRFSKFFIKKNKRTWNSDNKYIQIHSPNNIFIINKKKQQWILSVVLRNFIFCRELQIWIYYMAITKEFSFGIHHVKIDSGSGTNGSLKPK